MNLKVVLEPIDSRGFTEYAPALSGCVNEVSAEKLEYKELTDSGIECYILGKDSTPHLFLP